MEKIDLPDWAGDDYSEISDDDLEGLIVKTMKKLNEIIDWINTQ